MVSMRPTQLLATLRSIPIILLVAFVYALAGRLGLILAIPPGFATAIFPASGIALATVLLYGPRIWPGIFLGSLSLNLWFSIESMGLPQSAHALLIAAGIATGACLQGILGAWLIRRSVGDPLALQNERDILRFVLIAGPLSSLINGFLGPMWLCAQNIIELSEYGRNVFYWWLGDAIGAVVLTPIVLMIAQRKQPLWRRRFVSVGLPLSIALMLTVVFFVNTSRSMSEALEREFYVRSRSAENAIEATVGKYQDAIGLIARYTIFARDLDEEALHRLISPALAEHLSMESLAWIPKSLDQLPDDLQKETAERARDSGRTQVLSNSNTEESEARVLLVFQPVYDRDMLSDGDARRTHLRGLLRIGFLADEILKDSIRGTSHDALTVKFLEKREDKEVLLSRYPSSIPPAHLRGLRHPLKLTTDLFFFGRRFSLVIEPNELYQPVTSDKSAWSYMVACLFLTAVLGAFLLTITGRNFRAEELIESQRRLIKIEERFRFLAETVPNLVFMADGSGHFNFFNQKWLDYTGLKPHEILYDPLLIHPDDRPQMIQHWHASVKQGSPFDAEYRVRRSDGEYRWHLGRALPIFGEDGHLLNWFGSLTDIHDQKMKTEELMKMTVRENSARESSRLKSEFLATMSHEIRTPINGVIGMTTLLLDTPLSAQQQEYADAIRRSGDALLTVINDILDFSKIEAGRLEFEEINFPLRPSVEDAWLALKHSALKKGLRFEIRMDPDLPVYVRGDPGRLRQILSNLLSNAIKFTNEGGIVLSVALLRENETDDLIRFEVSDSGIGISPEQQKRLFQPFSQADSSTTRLFGGTGLGLSICQHLVKRMKGDIGVESGLGQGSTFWFVVTLGRAKQRDFQDELSPSLEPVPSEKRRRVLIVEDVQINQIIAVNMVEKLGHLAHAVANGREALAALHESSYNLILMDCQMPVMDGYEATIAIRSSKSLPNPNIPIIAMTADAMKGTRERCLDCGMDDYVSKPVMPHTLAKILDSWLERPLRADMEMN